jgi:hypothetical protein
VDAPGIEVRDMILIYILFALTFSTVLTALFSARAPEHSKEELFIGFFVALLAAAWAADVWILPALAAGGHRTWLAAATLILFGAMFIASAALAAGGRRLRTQAVHHNESRFDAEAAVFDLLLWVVLLIAGIALMRSAGF